MGFNFPEREELKSSVKADVQGVLVGSNPFLPEGFLNAFASSEGLRLFDFYEQLREELKQIFWDTAEGEFLERPAAWFNVFPLAATRALGNIVVQGTAGTVIPVSQTLTVSGINYTTQLQVSISSPIVISVFTLTSTSNTATVTTVGDHGQVTGLTVEIAGANEIVYNGTFTITVTGSDTFTYVFIGTDPGVGTGTITASFLNTLTLISLDAGGIIITAETAVPHNQATGITVTVGGADQTEYNGTFIITVTSTTKFTYILPTAPLVTPATGLLRAAFATALIPVLADLDSIGAQGNQLSGTALTFTSPPIAGIESIAFVDFLALTGGNDNEDQEAFRLRFLDRVQNPVANFNVAVIVQVVKAVPGNTRVFVQEVTPDRGQVTIYFTRDNDDIIPTPADETTTKDALLLIKPANTATIDMIVKAPVAKVVDFIFTTLTPNTSTMQTAVANSLIVFFEENTNIGTDVTELAYQSAIFNTIDVVTGERLQTFTLSQPIGDISVAPGELALAGTNVFP